MHSSPMHLHALLLRDGKELESLQPLRCVWEVHALRSVVQITTSFTITAQTNRYLVSLFYVLVFFIPSSIVERISVQINLQCARVHISAGVYLFSRYQSRICPIVIDSYMFSECITKDCTKRKDAAL